MTAGISSCAPSRLLPRPLDRLVLGMLNLFESPDYSLWPFQESLLCDDQLMTRHNASNLCD